MLLMLMLIFKSNDSQNGRERDLNLTHPPFKINGVEKPARDGYLST